MIAVLENDVLEVFLCEIHKIRTLLERDTTSLQVHQLTQTQFEKKYSHL